jgi:hypothetical protein
MPGLPLAGHPELQQLHALWYEVYRYYAVTVSRLLLTKHNVRARLILPHAASALAISLHERTRESVRQNCQA